MKATITGIDSTVVSKLAYNDSTGTLVAEFNSGAVYAYKDVPTKIWAAATIILAEGESLGTFLNRNVFRKFDCIKLEEAL